MTKSPKKPQTTEQIAKRVFPSQVLEELKKVANPPKQMQQQETKKK
jgi:hypothetical protein